MVATRGRISLVTHPKIQSYPKAYICAKFGALSGFAGFFA
jgi:hypothetical protein